jgi:hypothetical protein
MKTLCLSMALFDDHAPFFSPAFHLHRCFRASIHARIWFWGTRSPQM